MLLIGLRSVAQPYSYMEYLRENYVVRWKRNQHFCNVVRLNHTSTSRVVTVSYRRLFAMEVWDL